MPGSVFYEVSLREVFGNRKKNATCSKRIPGIGVEYFECRASQAYRLHSMLDINSPPFACDFSPTFSDLILIAQEDGLVHLYNTSLEGAVAFIQDYEAHANAVFDVKWLPSGSAFLTASGDQSIRLIDAEQGIVQQQFFGHTMSVRSLALMPSDSNIFASASRDGSIRLWDLRLKSDAINCRGIPGTPSIGLIPQCHLPNWSGTTESYSPTSRRPRTPSRRASCDAQSVTSVVFMSDNTLLSAGSTDGSIKMWDLRRVFSTNNGKKKVKPKCVFPYRGISQKRSGYSDLRLDSLRTRLYANCLDNVVYEYDLTRQSTSPAFVYTGHQTDSFYIKLDLSPDDGYLICGSSDRRAHIYAVGQRRQCPIMLSGHNGEVSIPRWCPGDPTRIVTLSDDSRAFVWNMFPARRCLLPEPGEVSGLAERPSPSKIMMSPSEQTKRVLRSPRLTPNNKSSGSVITRPELTGSPSLAASKRRQSNIRCFLETISPKSPLSIGSTHRISPSQPIGFTRLRNTNSLTETLGGVVQRFPGISSASQANVTVSTPPSGCYAASPAAKSPSTPSGVRSRRLPSPDHENSDTSDIENLSPNSSRHRMVYIGLPFDQVDSPALTKSPIICCNTDVPSSAPETPPASRRSRTPLVQQQSLFHTPQQRLTDERSQRYPRKRQGPDRYPDTSPTGTSSRFTAVSLPTSIPIEKRRRLTAFTKTDRPSSPSQPDYATPLTPTAVRRRRMTTLDRRPFRSITEYFRRDE
ncbi:Denticleless [Clonorchis sinensis]|uniref:Denticleless n=1 Tax=Clonorchis sinensis TaxID=79923 RepID=A0A8T1ME20_CLOSI|nr:Denticleless [Clonorchis sinensis]